MFKDYDDFCMKLDEEICSVTLEEYKQIQNEVEKELKEYE